MQNKILNKIHILSAKKKYKNKKYLNKIGQKNCRIQLKWAKCTMYGLRFDTISHSFIKSLTRFC